jgi:hypothetical protein
MTKLNMKPIAVQVATTLSAIVVTARSVRKSALKIGCFIEALPRPRHFASQWILPAWTPQSIQQGGKSTYTFVSPT